MNNKTGSVILVFSHSGKLNKRLTVKEILKCIKNGDFNFEPALKTLIEAGWDINEKNRWSNWIYYKHSLLLAIIKAKKFDLGFRLIELGAKINNENESLLYEAVEMDDFDLMKRFIDLGADYYGTNYRGKTAIYCACVNKNMPILDYLLELGVYTRVILKDCLNAVCSQKGRIVLIDRLLKTDPELLNDEQSCFEALSSAVENCVPSVVEHLVQKYKVDINSRSREGQTCFMVACTARYVNKKLIELGADPHAVNNEGMNGFHFACMSKRPKTIYYLIELDVDHLKADKNNLTGLHWACHSGDFALFKRVLDLGYDLKSMKPAKFGLLEAALVKTDNLKIVNLLLENGVSINEMNLNGENALFNNKFVIQFFLENGIDTNVVSADGRNALFDYIVKTSNPKYRPRFAWNALKQFILAKSELNLFDKDGMSAIHYICALDDSEFFEMFLEAGAQIHIPTTSGEYPFDLIMKKNPTSSLVKRLEDLGFNYSKENVWLRGEKCEKCLKMGCSLKTRCGHFVHVSCLNRDGLECPICGTRVTPYMKVEKYFHEGLTGSLDSFSKNELLYATENAIEIEVSDLAPYLTSWLINPNSDDIHRCPSHELANKECVFGRLDAIQILFSIAGKHINERNDTFHSACASGNLKLVSWLKEFGLDIDGRNSDGFYPIHVACCIGNVDVFDYLVDCEADLQVIQPYNNNSNVLHQACRAGHYEIVERLLNSGFDANSTDANKDTPLHYLCSDKSNLNFWSIFTFNNNDTSFSSSDEERIKIAKLLLKKGANIDAKNNNLHTVIEESCKYAEAALFDFFLTKIDDPQGYFLLPAAAMSGDFEFFKKILAIELEPKKTRPDGFNALMGACIGANLDIFKYVIDLGFDVKAKDSGDNTSFLYACSHANYQLQIFEDLVKKGANIHQFNKKNENAFHYAAKYLCNNIVKRLIELGVKSDSMNLRGESPVYLVLGNEHKLKVDEQIVLEMVKLLMTHMDPKMLICMCHHFYNKSRNCGLNLTTRYLDKICLTTLKPKLKLN